ncbi:MAG TPA: amino-acid N-acetyltransferase [Burkholderiaceae bacterium]|nr:amino-acid N-acetyltransferase [Burkholderiaceae bacterium]
MNDAETSLPAALVEATDAQFVTWLRDVAPYVHAHRGRTFVVGFGGELIEAGRLNALVHDLSLLQAMGIRLVIVHGSRPQVQAQLKLKGLESRFANGMRITDSAALECAKEASGEIRLDIEAAFSQGLPNTPMAHSQVRVISGNFVTARPVGVLDGVDFLHTGVVRKVEADAIRYALGANAIVLASPLGFSPTGEAFNLTMEDAATSIAAAIKADKLILITDTDGVRDRGGRLFEELTVAQVENLLAADDVDAESAYNLRYVLRACRGGVDRAHIIPFALDGAVLVELFTHDGIGTMLTTENLDRLREANIDDVGGILQLLAPLEAEGTLVKRPRELIEREIDRFTVLEHDGIIYGCAALYAFDAKTGEMAAVSVHPDYQNAGDGERLLRRIESRARAEGLNRLFVLTTRTAHWFIKRGFAPATVDDLPVERQRLYNWQRRSQIFVKSL